MARRARGHRRRPVAGTGPAAVLLPGVRHARRGDPARAPGWRRRWTRAASTPGCPARWPGRQPSLGRRYRAGGDGRGDLRGSRAGSVPSAPGARWSWDDGAGDRPRWSTASADDLVAADWPPITLAEVSRCSRRSGSTAVAVTWQSPRPLSAAALVAAGDRTVFVKRHSARRCVRSRAGRGARVRRAPAWRRHARTRDARDLATAARSSATTGGRGRCRSGARATTSTGRPSPGSRSSPRRTPTAPGRHWRGWPRPGRLRRAGPGTAAAGHQLGRHRAARPGRWARGLRRRPAAGRAALARPRLAAGRRTGPRAAARRGSPRCAEQLPPGWTHGDGHASNFLWGPARCGLVRARPRALRPHHPDRRPGNGDRAQRDQLAQPAARGAARRGRCAAARVELGTPAERRRGCCAARAGAGRAHRVRAVGDGLLRRGHAVAGQRARSRTAPICSAMPAGTPAPRGRHCASTCGLAAGWAAGR